MCFNLLNHEVEYALTEFQRLYARLEHVDKTEDLQAMCASTPMIVDGTPLNLTRCENKVCWYPHDFVA